MLKEKTIEQMRIRLREIRKELERVKGSIYDRNPSLCLVFFNWVLRT